MQIIKVEEGLEELKKVFSDSSDSVTRFGEHNIKQGALGGLSKVVIRDAWNRPTSAFATLSASGDLEPFALYQGQGPQRGDFPGSSSTSAFVTLSDSSPSDTLVAERSVAHARDAYGWSGDVLALQLGDGSSVAVCSPVKGLRGLFGGKGFDRSIYDLSGNASGKERVSF